MIHGISKHFEDKQIRRIEVGTDNMLYVKCTDGTTLITPIRDTTKAIVHFKKGAYIVEVPPTDGKLPKWLREED